MTDDDMPRSIRCRAVKLDGFPCRNKPLPGTEFCRWHGQQAELPEEELQPAEMPIEHRPYPFADGAVSENAAIRVRAMVIPNCSADPNPTLVARDGSERPNPRYTGEPNCQQAYKKNNSGVWDVQRCIKLGHDPYFTVFRKTVVEDVTDENGYVTESRNRVIKERRMNIIRVSDNPRHSTGMDPALARARGCIPLEDFVVTEADGTRWVYDPPCEFRNCSQRQQVITRYGRYCSERHARLVAADLEEVILPVGGDPYTEDKTMRERENILGSLNIRVGG